MLRLIQETLVGDVLGCGHEQVATENRRERERAHEQELSGLEKKMALEAAEAAAEERLQRNAALDEV